MITPRYLKLAAASLLLAGGLAAEATNPAGARVADLTTTADSAGEGSLGGAIVHWRGGSDVSGEAVNPAGAQAFVGYFGPVVPTAELTATIDPVVAHPNSRHRKWLVTFSEDVELSFHSLHLEKTGSLAGQADIGFLASGAQVVVLMAPTSADSSGTMGFEILPPLNGDDGGALQDPLVAPEATVAYHPPGDVNKDGVFDVGDALALSNALVGLAPLP
jgi:hypothetical protein